VADSAGGVAKAALTFSTTRSPLRTNCSMPPMAASAAATVLARSAPLAMAILRPRAGMA
jgi:hypothetical protein